MKCEKGNETNKALKNVEGGLSTVFNGLRYTFIDEKEASGMISCRKAKISFTNKIPILYGNR